MSPPNAACPLFAEVAVDIVRIVDAHWPGFVEARLSDIAGREWLFHDKVPIFTCEYIDAKIVLPQPGVIRCEVVGYRADPDGREIATIDTTLPDHVEATTGETRFEVSSDRVNTK